MRLEQLISADTRSLHLDEPIELDCGETLPGLRVAYRTWGQLASARDNAVLVCHALTGSADADAIAESARRSSA